LELFEHFGWTPPQFAHVPLVVGRDGRRLAKRHGDTRLSQLRAAGVPRERLVGWLAWSCGWQDEPLPRSAAELLPLLDWTRLPRQPWVLTAAMWRELSA
jgi:glutamyl-tRNA synthetase